MSSDTDAAAAVVDEFYSIYTEDYCIMAAAVLFIYDAFLTFDREVTWFWTAKRTGASLLFFANRWLTILYFVTVLVTFAPFPSDNVGSQSFAMAPAHSRICRAVTIVARVPLIVADILLIYITWTRLSSWCALKATAGLRPSNSLSLSNILFRGGIVYFAVLFGLNVLHLALSAAAVGDSGNLGESVVTTFTAPLTAVIVSHFLLELQEANKMDVRLDPGDPLCSSRDPYDTAPSFISSLGGFVNPGLSTRSDDDSLELQVRSRSKAPGEEEGGDPPETAKAAAESLYSA
ncbi:hypothetical protein OH76DRAFT_1485073 [Lentinus brumalis]|uniref:DUF6533 domain-containing protein n=1 Tax=Lentinus brumalis TaxID=2498619 RepID=A0A371D3B5_9APHY|nr:hypothetical protein OH76DRAFT_1485073 [Polyporus brumalis]